MNDYTVYLNKTDEIVATGTSRKCAASLGLTLDSFYCMVSRVRRGKNQKYSVVTTEEDDSDE